MCQQPMPFGVYTFSANVTYVHVQTDKWWLKYISCHAGLSYGHVLCTHGSGLSIPRRSTGLQSMQSIEEALPSEGVGGWKH